MLQVLHNCVLVLIHGLEAHLVSQEDPEEEELLPYGKEFEEARIKCEYSESAVLPVHHQALLVQHQASPQAKNS